MLVVLVVFFLFTMQRTITDIGLSSVLTKVIPDAEGVVLEYEEAVIKNNWYKNLKKNIYVLSSSYYKLYLIWPQTQCRYPNNFEFLHSNLLKFCVCSNVKIMRFAILETKISNMLLSRDQLYESQNMLNLDELELFIKSLPEKGLIEKEKKSQRWQEI